MADNDNEAPGRWVGRRAERSALRGALSSAMLGTFVLAEEGVIGPLAFYIAEATLGLLFVLKPANDNRK